MRTKSIFVAMLLASAPLPGVAQDFDAGWSAYQSGDYAAALQEFMPLAKQGDVDAQYNLGLLYEKGRGVPQDYAEAVRWYRLAAEQGNVRAQTNLGVMYDKGQGILQDYAEAVRWYRAAAQQGSAPAQNNLGFMYGQGRGVRQDYVLAHMWANIAAANGIEKAAELRALLDTTMMLTDISEAQRLARICMASSYQDCM